jgi:hypothetical protein
MRSSRTLRDERTTPAGTSAEHTMPHAEPFPWLPILVLGFAWFLAVAIELSPAGLLGAIAADLDVSVVAVGTMTTFYALGNGLRSGKRCRTTSCGRQPELGCLSRSSSISRPTRSARTPSVAVTSSS